MHTDYRCQQTGYCCRANWDVLVEARPLRLMRRAAAAGRLVLAADSIGATSTTGGGLSTRVRLPWLQRLGAPFPRRPRLRQLERVPGQGDTDGGEVPGEAVLVVETERLATASGRSYDRALVSEAFQIADLRLRH
jgi:hypothetical protein